MCIKKQIIIEKWIGMTRIGVMDDYVLKNYFVETPLVEEMTNRIVVGQVEKVVKNLEAAFVHFGEEKKGLLHFKQVPDCYKNKLQQGARLPVQIIKENTGHKGHKLTSFLTLQGYYLVCMLHENQLCISKKIKDIALREAIQSKLAPYLDSGYGFIVRTKAQTCALEDLEEEANQLIRRAEELNQIKDHLSRGSILAKEAPIYIQAIREHLSKSEGIEIICNDTTIKEEIENYFYQSRGNKKIQFSVYPYSERLFDLFSLEKKIASCYQSKVWLKNGGNIVIDYTEAMTVIDVNSAKAVIKKDFKKATKELNQLAIKEALSQVILRNLSGMIVIDLVTMQSKEDEEELYAYAKALIRREDSERTQVFPLTELGLMQWVRAKKYNALPDLFLSQCTCCQRPKSQHHPLYTLYQLELKLKQLHAHTTQERVYCYCSQELYHLIKTTNWDKTFQEVYPFKIEWQVNKKQQASYFEVKYHEAKSLTE